MSPTPLFPSTLPTPLGYQDVTPASAQAAIGRIRIVDVREPAEFTDSLGHIASAELVPLATVPTAAAAWSRSAPLLLVCRSGGRSGRAAGVLTQMGFTVYNMAGGMLAWNAEGRPVERQS